MANLIQLFKFILITLSFLFIFISHTTSSSSNNKEIIQSQTQSQNPSSTTTELSHYHQVFYLKNTDPTMFLNKQERIKKMRMMIKNKDKNKNMMKKHRKLRKHRKKMVKNMMKSSLKPFSVMLPKGFVPPSGSSPCHNDQPNSVSFHCYLTSTEP